MLAMIIISHSRLSYVHDMSLISTVSHPWLRYIHYLLPTFTICHFCLPHDHFVTAMLTIMSFRVDLVIICHPCLPHVISNLDTYWICCKSSPDVIPGLHMFTIFHLCLLYVTCVYNISSLVVICSPFFHLCLLYKTCAQHLISGWDMFTICHLCQTFKWKVNKGKEHMWSLVETYSV